MERKVGTIEVFGNTRGNIVIAETGNEWNFAAIEIDECMAEKLCKFILEVAKEIRG